MSERRQAVCWGTKEREPCDCGGDKSKCNFYSDVREKSKTESYSISLKLLQQLIFECAMDLDYGYKTKDELVDRLIDLSHTSITENSSYNGVYRVGKQIKELPIMTKEQIQECKDAIAPYIKD